MPQKRQAKSGVAAAESRRGLILDAALEVLAREGSRGLTHRAIDRHLELPSGSTSYYFRTRGALLLAAAERLVELDLQDLSDAIESCRSPVADEVAAILVSTWSASEARGRSLARFELFLTAARDPEFEFVKKTREHFLQQLRGKHADADTNNAAMTQVSLVDGLVLHGLLYGGMSQTEARRSLGRIEKKPASTRARRK